MKPTKPATKSLWLARYDRQVVTYIKKHFGRSGGITQLFPYMKDNFTWSGKTDPADPRAAQEDTVRAGFFALGAFFASPTNV